MTDAKYSSCDDESCKQTENHHKFVCKSGGKQGINASPSCDVYCEQKDDDNHQHVCKNVDQQALDGLDRPNPQTLAGLDKPNQQHIILREKALQSYNNDDEFHGDFGGKDTESVTIDEVLSKWVGEFGRAQIVHFTLTSLAWALEALHTLVTIFADNTPPWRCTNNVNSTALSHLYMHNNASNYIHMSASNAAITHVNSSSYNGFTYTASACIPSSSLCSLPPSLWEWIKKDESTVSQWNLVCASSYMQGLAQSCFFIGCLLGAGTFGHLSDSRLGRRGAFMLACMLNAVCGMLTAASPTYWVYILMRAGTGICSGGLGLTSFVLGTELIGPSRRTSVAMSALYFYPLGLLLLTGMATLTSRYSWRILYIATSVPSVLYCLFILPFLFESPRWYLVRGRSHDALRVLKVVAKLNGTAIPRRIILRMDEQDDDVNDKLHNLHVNNKTPQIQQKSGIILEGSEMQHLNGGASLMHTHTLAQSIEVNGICCNTHKPETNEASKSCKEAHDPQNVKCKGASGTLMDVFRGEDTRLRMAILVVVWFASALGYYAFNLNVGNLGTNLTTSVLLNALAEAPGYAITTFLLDRVGRRITLIAALLLTASSSLLGAILSYELRGYHTTPHFDYNLSAFNQSTINYLPINSTLVTNATNALNTTTPLYPSHFHIHSSHLQSSIQLACGLIGLFSIAGTYNLIYLYTTELFPTVVRNVALGLANQAGAVGSIVAPIVALSAHVNSSFPFFIIGTVSLVGGIMAIKLPETLNLPFHETLEGMRRASEQA
ncbi:hypothetical protein L7F22_068594 [Adiantum nelumboides]|nr:hypothetical protein [Adiantum nelumboides]